MKPMITNETRAKLIGRTWMHLDVPCEGDGYAGCGLVPWDPEHDANAVAELRAFVRARGEMRKFVDALINELHDEWRREDRDNRTGFTETRFDLIDATPARQCAAFDIVFKDELERIQ